MEFPSSGMDLDSRRDSGNSGFGDGATGGGSGNPLASPGPSSGGMGGPGGGNAGSGGGLIGGKKRRSESDVEGGRSGGAADNTMQLSLESIRGFTEILGMPASSGILPEDAGKELSEEVTFRIRLLIQDAQRFMLHAKRTKLLSQDVDLALRLEGLEPLYGLSTSEHVPFRYASGGGRELHFNEEKEVDLTELASAPLPKIPMGVSLRAHWLAIDGVQPSIPENPPAQSKEQLSQESSNPLSKLNTADAKDNKLSQVLQSKPTKLKNMETVNVKQLASHELSVEQQLYYKEITEACVGSDEGKRAEALQSLACDPGLHQMLPRLCTFIAEGVRVNVVQHNLAILIYLMRMVKSLLENQTLFLEKYLHELIPAVTTCIVSRQLCTRPDVDNHWALRDFASRLMANICKNFNTSTNNIQTRVTRMFSDCLKNENGPLVSYYGAVAGLQELGPEVIKVFILPHIKFISNRIDLAMDPAMAGSSLGNIEKIAGQHIRNLIIKSVTPVLKSLKATGENAEDFREEYGALGTILHSAVERMRQSSQSSAAGSGGQQQQTAASSSLKPPSQQTATVAAVAAPATPSASTAIGSRPSTTLIQAAAPTGTQSQQRVIVMSSATGVQPQHSNPGIQVVGPTSASATLQQQQQQQLRALQQQQQQQQNQQSFFMNQPPQ